MTGEPAPDIDVVVTWSVPAAEAEARAADLWAAGATAVEWQEPPEPPEPDKVTLVAGYPTPDAARAVARELGAETREIDGTAWRDVWKQFAEPIEVMPRLVIAPAWRPVSLAAPGKENQVVIEIDPGPCFGSGSHPSTRLLLAALADRPPVGQNVLDVGTGSGILAVAAARLGASRVVAVDIDPTAIEVTAANAARNRVSHLVHPETTDVGHLDEAFSLLLVNVTAGVHAAVGRHVVERAAPQATLLLAGLLPNQWRHVAPAYPGCTVVDRPQLDGWEGVVLRRR